MFNTGRYRRKKSGTAIRSLEIRTLDNPPIRKQSLAKGSSIALVSPVEFSTSSWRRAVLSLEEHHKAWLLWCYSGSICWEHQIAIMQWAWTEFNAQSGTRYRRKNSVRLKTLIWLAAQAVKAELFGGEGYEYQELALLVGVTTKKLVQDIYWSLGCNETHFSSAG